MHRLTLLLLALILTASASAQDNSTTEIDSLLPGTWAMTTQIHDSRIEDETTFTSDNEVEEIRRVIHNGIVATLNARGSWKVDGDIIVTTYTESSPSNFVPVGTVNRSKVTFIDEHQLSISGEEGSTGTMHRVR